jgi:D-alanyl-D-alanine carboxypeptidase
LRRRLAIAFKHPAIFAPRKEYDYCNTNYVLLGLIAEKLERAPRCRFLFHIFSGSVSSAV